MSSSGVLHRLLLYMGLLFLTAKAVKDESFQDYT